METVLPAKGSLATFWKSNITVVLGTRCFCTDVADYKNFK